jgi:formiminoglutamase
MTLRDFDPQWPTARSWIAGEHSSRPLAAFGLLGIPLCKGSITPGRCDLTPKAIRDVLKRFSSYDLHAAHDLRELSATDFGDLDLAQTLPGDAATEIVEAVEKALQSVDLLTILGGDNTGQSYAFFLNKIDR